MEPKGIGNNSDSRSLNVVLVTAAVVARTTFLFLEDCMKRSFVAIAAVAALAMATRATAGSIEVQVGYADNLRPSPFFPNPWQGGAGVALFAGGGGSFDAGAIRLINTGATNVTINGLTVDHFRDGASYTLWNGFLGLGFNLAPGQSAIFTQTFSYNFDTSDDSAGGTPGSPSTVVPHVNFTVDGVSLSFNDTGHVLDTGGFDLANYPALSPTGDGNEALNWRTIGTTGIEDPGGTGVAPEPTSLTLLGLGVLGMGSYSWRKRKQRLVVALA